MPAGTLSCLFHLHRIHSQFECPPIASNMAPQIFCQREMNSIFRPLDWFFACHCDQSLRMLIEMHFVDRVENEWCPAPVWNQIKRYGLEQKPKSNEFEMNWAQSRPPNGVYDIKSFIACDTYQSNVRLTVTWSKKKSLFKMRPIYLKWYSRCVWGFSNKNDSFFYRTNFENGKNTGASRKSKTQINQMLVRKKNRTIVQPIRTLRAL